MKMDVKQAADAIRDNIAQPPPDARHFTDFASRVTLELGMEATPINVSRVMHSLYEAGVEPVYAEYPKWVGEGERAVIVHDEAEEQDYLAKSEGAEPPSPNAESSQQEPPLTADGQPHENENAPPPAE